ncbi:alpha/beta hydrolase [Roseomonas sp. HJA6]|uniref:Alpha/beta hydrolase n=1 Tax=Roseomonas alba TaxID=2846776 RepID=A0ABS7A6F3_9PROT|nr:alpha/beta hydrolase [Neoroseomonas alba]MBW6397680.1 alpha/beta hydrolase [Neoroseomonas alba]
MVGRTPFFVAAADPRFPYCLYVPRRRAPGPAPLIVAVHGSDRRPEVLRTLHAPLCDRVGAVLLAPLFPIGSVAPDDEPGYKVCLFRGVRYDHALLAMVEDAARRVPIATDRFVMTGFSGGAQFALRFMLLHPHRLSAVSIGAPGYVTLLDPALPWWAGTGNFVATFDHEPDIAAIRKVSIQIVIGTKDTALDMIPLPQGDQRLRQAVALAGETRIARSLSLEASLRASGCDPRVEHVEGAAHAVRDVFPAVERFLETCFPA